MRFSVNMPTLDRAELEDLRLYLNLAWRLGMLHAQMDRGTLKSARVIYRGEVEAERRLTREGALESLEHDGADQRQREERHQGGSARRRNWRLRLVPIGLYGTYALPPGVQALAWQPSGWIPRSNGAPLSLQANIRCD